MSVVQSSFIRFVYPVLFDPEKIDDLVGAVESAQCGSLGPLWEREHFPDRDLLRHVAQYLNPPDDVPATARLWKIPTEVLQSPQGLGSGPQGQGAEWTLASGETQTRFRIEDVQLILFRVGVGFVTLRVHPEVEELDGWLDFLHFFRFLRRKDVTVSARRRTGIDEQRQPVFTEYFPDLATKPDPNAGEARDMSQLIDGLLRTAAPTTGNTDSANWWSEVFVPGQLLPCAVLLTDGLPAGQEPHLLYRVHNFFHSGQGQHPAPEELRMDQEHLLPYAERQWFVLSLDGAAFVGCDLPQTEFFQQTLLHHLDEHYLLAFLLALHQRFALMSFSDSISRHWLPEPGNDSTGAEDRREHVFRQIRNRFLQFTARGYFAQVMQRRHHHRCYAKWQEIFQIDRLFQEVAHEVREMHDYLLMKRTENLERKAESTQRFELWLSKFAAFFIPPALSLGFLDALGNNTFTRTAIVTGASLVVSGFLMAVLHWSAKSPRE